MNTLAALLTAIYGDDLHVLPKDLQAKPHHHHWVSLQSGVPLAPRAVLSVIVERHAGFQADNPYNTFFMVEDYLAPIYMPNGMAWKTFENHRSVLVRLGLLDLVWRAPNQWGRWISMWRIRYDRFLIAKPRRDRVAGEPKYVVLDIDEAPVEDIHKEDIALEAQASLEAPIEVQPTVAVTALIESKGLDAEEILQGGGTAVVTRPKTAVARPKTRQRSKFRGKSPKPSACTCTCKCGAQQVTHQSGNGSRHGEHKAPVLVEYSPPLQEDKPPEDVSRWEKAVRREIKRELDIDLADEDMKRFRYIETLWQDQWHTRERPIDHHFLTYAIRRTREVAPDRPIGYVLAVLERTVRKGYTEDGGAGYRQADRGLDAEKDAVGTDAPVEDSAVSIDDMDEESLRAAIEECLANLLSLERMLDMFASVIKEAEDDEDDERLERAKGQVHSWESNKASREVHLAQLQARLAEIIGDNAGAQEEPAVADEAAPMNTSDSQADMDGDNPAGEDKPTSQDHATRGNGEQGLPRTQRRKLKRVQRRKKAKKRN